MRVESHMANLRESLDVIEECIQRGNLVERQRTVGFHCSQAGVDMLEALLHKLNLITPGTQIQHNWFKSEKVGEKFPFDFPKKNGIFMLMIDIEKKRDTLCYGKPQPVEVIEGVIEKFGKLRDIFDELGVV